MAVETSRWIETEVGLGRRRTEETDPHGGESAEEEGKERAGRARESEGGRERDGSGRETDERRERARDRDRERERGRKRDRGRRGCRKRGGRAKERNGGTLGTVYERRKNPHARFYNENVSADATETNATMIERRRGGTEKHEGRSGPKRP